MKNKLLLALLLSAQVLPSIAMEDDGGKGKIGFSIIKALTGEGNNEQNNPPHESTDTQPSNRPITDGSFRNHTILNETSKTEEPDHNSSDTQ